MRIPLFEIPQELRGEKNQQQQNSPFQIYWYIRYECGILDL